MMNVWIQALTKTKPPYYDLKQHERRLYLIADCIIKRSKRLIRVTGRRGVAAQAAATHPTPQPGSRRRR